MDQFSYCLISGATDCEPKGLQTAVLLNLQQQAQAKADACGGNFSNCVEWQNGANKLALFALDAVNVDSRTGHLVGSSGTDYGALPDGSQTITVAANSNWEEIAAALLARVNSASFQVSNALRGLAGMLRMSPPLYAVTQMQQSGSEIVNRPPPQDPTLAALGLAVNAKSNGTTEITFSKNVFTDFLACLSNGSCFSGNESAQTASNAPAASNSGNSTSTLASGLSSPASNFTPVKIEGIHVTIYPGLDKTLPQVYIYLGDTSQPPLILTYPIADRLPLTAIMQGLKPEDKVPSVLGYPGLPLNTIDGLIQASTSSSGGRIVNVPADDGHYANVRTSYGFLPQGTPIIIDENIYHGSILAEEMKKSGYNAVTVQQIFGGVGTSDQQIYDLATRLGGLVLTADHGGQLDADGNPIGGFFDRAVKMPMGMKFPATYVRYLEAATDGKVIKFDNRK